MKRWYTIQAAAGDTVADVNVFDDIGGWGINAKQFLADIKGIGASTIRLFINSPGGSVFDAVTMFNGLRASGKRIEVTVMGVAASAASFLALAGDKITMPENTFMFLHNPISGVYGNAEDMRDMADALDKIGSSITAMYAKRWTGTDAELSDVLAAETYLTAAECLARGLCDEVTDPMAVEAKFDVERLPDNVRALFEARKPEAEPEPAPVVLPVATLADRIRAAVDCAGLGEFAAHFALDPSLTDDDSIRAAVTNALEVKALCDIAAMPDKAGDLIRARKPLADVRAELCASLQVEAQQSHVSTTPAAKPAASPHASVNPTEIYARRNSNDRSKK